MAVGGGYDNCEDGSPNAACSGAKGSIVYILDAADGSKLASFTTAGRVVMDVVFVDLDGDRIPDLAYAADTRGNIYRINFGYSKSAPLPAANWTSTLIAGTTGSNRKFLYPPALYPGYDSGTGKFYVYLALGTGDREQPLLTQYPYATPVLNRFYVFVDDITSTAKADLDDSTAMSDFTAATSCNTSRVLPGSGKSGWFMDLNAYGRGEQTVTSAVIVNGFVAFSTNRAVPPSANVCAPAGEARGYARRRPAPVAGGEQCYCQWKGRNDRHRRDRPEWRPDQRRGAEPESLQPAAAASQTRVLATGRRQLILRCTYAPCPGTGRSPPSRWDRNECESAKRRPNVPRRNARRGFRWLAISI
ncbi:MAG: hypothetical protein E6H67_15965 [Betaproteobacteria bacterium]|nr:MAG: hypothetical protein E6H67_15965 [Betaproteobacteria bacterium]